MAWNLGASATIIGAHSSHIAPIDLIPARFVGEERVCAAGASLSTEELADLVHESDADGSWKESLLRPAQSLNATPSLLPSLPLLHSHNHYL